MSEKIRVYTGIGSRQTPGPILNLMTRTAKFLDRKGFYLRSGGADGADTAFENGAMRKAIYLPWKGFNGSKSDLWRIPEEAYELARATLQGFDSLKPGVKKLMARNMMQVLGSDLKSPSEFLICWTVAGQMKGGTRAAMSLAIKNGIPVYNLALDEGQKRLAEFLKGL